MNYMEADTFFEREVRGRFSKWKPEPAEISDWLFWLKGMDEDPALRAIREHKSESRYNTPALSTFKAKVAAFSPHKERPEQPEDSVFILYEGGGQGTLVAGYFIPVIIKAGNIMKIADQVKTRMERWVDGEKFGGDWKVYSETTHQAMVQLRFEIRKAITNAA